MQSVSVLGTSVAAYLCGIMVVLGIIIAIGLFRQKAGKSKK
jgi:prolipoprotein diacylglyceryltransferase